MSSALLVSHVLLWLLVLVLAIVVLALVRQVGALQTRIAPVGALVPVNELRVGEAAPRLIVEDLEGRTIHIGEPRNDGQATLLVWVAPGCPVCQELLPVLDSVQRQEGHWLRVLLTSDGDRSEHERYWRERVGKRLPYILSAPLGHAYQVPKVPYAVLIDAQGVLRAMGLVNSREHVESLFEAMERRVASVQEFLARGGESVPAPEGR